MRGMGICVDVAAITNSTLADTWKKDPITMNTLSSCFSESSKKKSALSIFLPGIRTDAQFAERKYVHSCIRLDSLLAPKGNPSECMNEHIFFPQIEHPYVFLEGKYLARISFSKTR